MSFQTYDFLTSVEHKIFWRTLMVQTTLNLIMWTKTWRHFSKYILCSTEESQMDLKSHAGIFLFLLNYPKKQNKTKLDLSLIYYVLFGAQTYLERVKSFSMCRVCCEGCVCSSPRCCVVKWRAEIGIRQEMAIATLTSTLPSLDLSYCPSPDFSPLHSES